MFENSSQKIPSGHHRLRAALVGLGVILLLGGIAISLSYLVKISPPQDVLAPIEFPTMTPELALEKEALLTELRIRNTQPLSVDDRTKFFSRLLDAQKRGMRFTDVEKQEIYSILQK